MMVHRKATQEGIDLIKKFEGFRDNVYKDIAGFDTIGYGHLIRKGENFPKRISETEGESLLRRDLRMAEKSILRLIKVPLTDNQFDALCSFVFNLGAGALQRSTLRQKLNRGEYFSASNEFFKWCISNGVRVKGLLRRRKEERLLFIA